MPNQKVCPCDFVPNRIDGVAFLVLSLCAADDMAVGPLSVTISFPLLATLLVTNLVQ